MPEPRFELHLDAAQGLAALGRSIQAARHRIQVNSFIWRNDGLGLGLLKDLGTAAERGVAVRIQKDLTGWVFERAEENGGSLFHGIDWLHLPAAWALNAAYYPRWVAAPPSPTCLEAILAHPNLELVAARTLDHSKYVVVDDDVLFLGGINLEDRFLRRSSLGHRWQDVFLRLQDRDLVAHFTARLRGEAPGPGPIEFILNDPRGRPRRRFEWKARVLDMLEGAARSVAIAVAYHGDPAIMAAIQNGLKRGLDTTLLFSAHSNVQQDLNLACARRLHDQGARIRLWPGMFHGKLLVIDDAALLGSANLNRSSNRLGETDLWVQNHGTGTALFGAIQSAMTRLMAQGRAAEGSVLGPSPLRSFLEYHLS